MVNHLMDYDFFNCILSLKFKAFYLAKIFGLTDERTWVEYCIEWHNVDISRNSLVTLSWKVFSDFGGNKYTESRFESPISISK